MTKTSLYAVAQAIEGFVTTGTAFVQACRHMEGLGLATAGFWKGTADELEGLIDEMADLIRQPGDEPALLPTAGHGHGPPSAPGPDAPSFGVDPGADSSTEHKEQS